MFLIDLFRARRTVKLLLFQLELQVNIQVIQEIRKPRNLSEKFSELICVCYNAFILLRRLRYGVFVYKAFASTVTEND